MNTKPYFHSACVVGLLFAQHISWAQQTIDSSKQAAGIQAPVCSTLAPPGAPGLWVPDRQYLWNPGSTLKIRFIDGSPENRRLVLDAVKDWTALCNIFFREVTEAGDIRIKFAEKGYWSVIGTKARSSTKAPSMNLGFEHEDSPKLDKAQKHAIILHEFGHALGFGHEHQSPNARINWNRAKVLEVFSGPPNNWSPKQIESNILNPTRPDEDKRGLWSEFDSKSIMIYPIPKELTADGFSVGWAAKLSAIDKNKAAQHYPRE